MTIRKRLATLVQPSRRKLTLFACSCVREIWHLLEDARSKASIIAAENYVDGLISKEEMRKAAATNDAVGSDAVYSITNTVVNVALRAGWAVIGSAAIFNAIFTATNQEQAIAKQHQLLDDIFGV